MESLKNFDQLLKKARKKLSEADLETFLRACYLSAEAHGGQVYENGRPYVEHSLAVSCILLDLNVDLETMVAGVLHDTLATTSLKFEDLKELFGQDVAQLVGDVTKMEEYDRKVTSEENRAEYLQKLIIAAANDVRVILLKLADRLHQMRSIESLPGDTRGQLARETLDIFAPIAEKLGIPQLKSELEDRAFKHLHPEEYRRIERQIYLNERQQQKILRGIKERIFAELRDRGIEIDDSHISCRPKHIYGIYRKLQTGKYQGYDALRVYDRLGIRLIVPEVGDCYVALGVIHSIWQHIDGEFDDYISNPRQSGYQSLHTAVQYGPDPRRDVIEIQIRTLEMHYEAEYGIAAHWRYKYAEDGKRDVAHERKVAWLRHLMEWISEEGGGDSPDPRTFLESVRDEVFPEQVYVFTPKGRIMELRKGSTPIDMAYHIHTEVGHRCRGAKVNGQLKTLDYKLKTGDQVEVITAKRGGPSRDWLNPDSGYVCTQRARSKIRQWFRKQARDDSIQQGRAILERELKKLGLETLSYAALSDRFGYEKVDDMLAAIGYGDINTRQIAGRSLYISRPPEEDIPISAPPRTPVPRIGTEGVQITGVGNLMYNVAQCCNPIPGDDIIGYVTRGRGVTIHRRDCPNMLRVREPERLVAVNWSTSDSTTYPVTIHIEAYDRPGLLFDVAAVLSNRSSNLSLSGVTAHRKDDMISVISVSLEIEDVEQLVNIMSRLERISGVFNVYRQAG